MVCEEQGEKKMKRSNQVILLVLVTLLAILIIVCVLCYRSKDDSLSASSGMAFEFHKDDSHTCARRPPMIWESVSSDPHVVVIHNFLTADECKQLIDLADPLFAPSSVIGHGNSHVKSADRTSHSASLPSHPLVTDISNRCAKLAMLPASHVETIQVVRYNKSQFYRVHHDGFTATDSKQQAELDREGQRLDTFFVYLNDLEPDETGGCTHFPSLHLKVQPRRGAAVFWKNCLPGTQTLDARVQHAGLPVSHSIKYGVNIWTRAYKR
jgi:prolyl 4-hydroxylase